MSKYTDRYAGAVHSGNLRSKDSATTSDADVLGAAGLAGKHKPLAMALMRLFVGDNRGVSDLVALLTEMAWGKAHAERVKLKRPQAEDMARAVLAWHRDGTCKACSGHGYKVIGTVGEGRAVLSDAPCPACKGTRKMPFDSQFSMERLLIARWLLAEIEREQAAAGQAAMAKLAPRLDL